MPLSGPSEPEFDIPPDEALAPSGSSAWRQNFSGFLDSTVGRFLLVLFVVFIAKQALICPGIPSVQRA